MHYEGNRRMTTRHGYAQIMKEIEDLQQKADEEIRQARREIARSISEIMAKHRITLRDLAEFGAGHHRYFNRETGQKWSGRGRMPKWLKEHLSAGQDIDVFRVDPTQLEAATSSEPTSEPPAPSNPRVAGRKPKPESQGDVTKPRAPRSLPKPVAAGKPTRVRKAKTVTEGTGKK
jgi:DNA-binding protein H-NS